jgi:RHS repeat-associated protein
LGNNREVWRASSKTTIQRTQYYASGLPWETTPADNLSLQPYKYNGKEFVEMHGYDTYDYGARGYYAAMGRFTSVDPHAEKYYSISPYAYCAGNPVNRIDPDGMDWYKDKDGTRQYDPNVTSQDNLSKGQTYIGVTDAGKDKNGNVIENYRKDGSIMYVSESSAYSRIWNNSIKTGHEEEGIITDKGVLVLPDYKNDASNVDLKDYNYSTKNGNIVDASGNQFNTIATVHTHLEGSLPSSYDYTGFGDLGFAAWSTPNKAVFVLQMTPNKIDPISFIISGANPHSNFSNFNNYDTYEINKSNLNVQMLLHGTSLRGYTINNAINKLRKIP